jgi:hypothetical protein
MTQDVGAIGVTGNVAYSNGVFTVTGGGRIFKATATHFVLFT